MAWTYPIFLKSVESWPYPFLIIFLLIDSFNVLLFFLEECGFFDEAAAMACIEMGPAGYLACLLTLCGAVAYEECIYVCD